MTATEILANETFSKSTINFLGTRPARAHYKSCGMLWGRIFPTTKEQVKFFLHNGVAFDLLTCKDVEMIESFCAKHGLANQCRYRLTGSERYARLTNGAALIEAWKKEYNTNFRY